MAMPDADIRLVARHDATHAAIGWWLIAQRGWTFR
ncbi:hypothetical protein BMS3Bbin02_01545 [bacterium BMS3Bbin02]|nr:hypothetical protein BMS3Bbin02_01545 [bacterium BMS3Bbin02]